MFATHMTEVSTFDRDIELVQNAGGGVRHDGLDIKPQIANGLREYIKDRVSPLPIRSVKLPGSLMIDIDICGSYQAPNRFQCFVKGLFVEIEPQCFQHFRRLREQFLVTLK